MEITIGSICSGIEAASVAFKDLSFKFSWFSEIAPFQSSLLSEKYPDIINLKDMNDIPNKILNKEIETPDIICGGTPCNSFSFAGLKKGLNDNRGNLSLKFVEIINENDKIRLNEGKKQTIVFWENVEGVLSDKTNAFGFFISLLAGLENPLECKKWATSGVLRGPKRNIAWRILDSKYFGIPQQRKRLYLIAGPKNFFPENILFEIHKNDLYSFPKNDLIFNKDGHNFQLFREYTDCLYASYGTKWNGNAAAYNGSLFIVQNNQLRRFSPLECERLMGFPDNYTNISSASNTNRYKSLGNSWAIPVIFWIGKRLYDYIINNEENNEISSLLTNFIKINQNINLINFSQKLVKLNEITTLNCSFFPEKFIFSDLKNIVDINPSKSLYLSEKACNGILYRANKNNLKINEQLKFFLINNNK